MTELEKKDEILKLLTKALIIAIDDDVNLTLRAQILPTSIHNKDKISSK